MRTDAQRNAEQLRAAGAELFLQRGLEAALKEIARRAGVSHRHDDELDVPVRELRRVPVGREVPRVRNSASGRGGMRSLSR